MSRPSGRACGCGAAAAAAPTPPPHWPPQVWIWLLLQGSIPPPRCTCPAPHASPSCRPAGLPCASLWGHRRPGHSSRIGLVWHSANGSIAKEAPTRQLILCPGCSAASSCAPLSGRGGQVGCCWVDAHRLRYRVLCGGAHRVWGVGGQLSAARPSPKGKGPPLSNARQAWLLAPQPASPAHSSLPVQPPPPCRPASCSLAALGPQHLLGTLPHRPAAGAGSCGWCGASNRGRGWAVWLRTPGPPRCCWKVRRCGWPVRTAAQALNCCGRSAGGGSPAGGRLSGLGRSMCRAQTKRSAGYLPICPAYKQDITQLCQLNNLDRSGRPRVVIWQGPAIEPDNGTSQRLSQAPERPFPSQEP